MLRFHEGRYFQNSIVSLLIDFIICYRLQREIKMHALGQHEGVQSLCENGVASACGEYHCWWRRIAWSRGNGSSPAEDSWSKCTVHTHAPSSGTVSSHAALNHRQQGWRRRPHQQWPEATNARKAASSIQQEISSIQNNPLQRCQELRTPTAHRFHPKKRRVPQYVGQAGTRWDLFLEVCVHDIRQRSFEEANCAWDCIWIEEPGKRTEWPSRLRNWVELGRTEYKTIVRC